MHLAKGSCTELTLPKISTEPTHQNKISETVIDKSFVLHNLIFLKANHFQKVSYEIVDSDKLLDAHIISSAHKCLKYGSENSKKRQLIVFSCTQYMYLAAWSWKYFSTTMICLRLVKKVFTKEG